MSKEFTPITTQEDFDAAIQERLKREKEKFADYEELKTKNEALEAEIGTLKSALEESNTKIGSYDQSVSELQKKIADYETASLKTKIALQKGLPYALASRLVGDDEESINADAEKLSELIKRDEPVAPLKTTEPQIGDSEDSAYRSLLDNLNLKGE